MGFDICLQRCLDAVRNVWTVENNVLFESRSGLHDLGFRVLQLAITVANVSPDVFAAKGHCSLSTTQVQHVDQLLDRKNKGVPKRQKWTT